MYYKYISQYIFPLFNFNLLFIEQNVWDFMEG